MRPHGCEYLAKARIHWLECDFQQVMSLLQCQTAMCLVRAVCLQGQLVEGQTQPVALPKGHRNLYALLGC